jgi:hemoglobin/transferrin/lactoferrin receptor protein
MRLIPFVAVFAASSAFCQVTALIEGMVSDSSGAVVPNVSIQVLSAQGAVVRMLHTDQQGRFTVSGLRSGSYAVEALADSFEKATAALQVPSPDSEPLNIRLEVARTNSEITVTSRRGAVEDVETATQLVTSRGRDQLIGRPLQTVANALEGAPGVTVQQTTTGAASPILHGLTGYQTLLLLDGMRFNTSIFRSGPNQYIALIDPSTAERVEVTLGPSSANYGSDSMGGTINVLTVEPRFGTSGSPSHWHGEQNLIGSSADLSGATSTRATMATQRVAVTIGGAISRHNDLRAGRGDDSHNVYRRYFGLSHDQMQSVFGDRLQNTGFLQYSVDGRLGVRLSQDQTVSLRYIRSDMQNVRSYRDQYGGANKMESLFDPQSLNFAWARYEKLHLGLLDSISGTFSFNQQNDGAVVKNPLITDVVTSDNSRVNSYGYASQATTHLGPHFAAMFGGELYDEHIFSERFAYNPVANAITQDRALYPNNSRYRNGGLFLQTSTDLFRDHLRLSLGGRYTGVRYITTAADNVTDAGEGLGVIDSSRYFGDTTYNAGLDWRVTGGFAISATASRGFRAPNVNDLGTVGARTLGYDVTTEDAIAVNALMGLDSSDTAGLSGKKVSALGPETLANYELGFRFQTSRLYVRVQFFDAELKHPISSRTLLFPVDDVPSTIGGVAVTPLAQSAVQKSQGVVAVVTSLTPRAVHTSINDGKSRYFGADQTASFRITTRWTIESNYSFLGGLDLNPVRPTRRLPPQEGGLRLRYAPTGRRPWFEVGFRIAGPQNRLNGGDIDDDRIGASRRRSDIATFFKSYTVAPFINPGADHKLGTADDIFTATNESLLQIQDRVLPLNTVINGVLVSGNGIRVPLYPKVPGWTALNFRGGYPLREKLALTFGVNNVLDHNYRAIGSGVDAPGINVFAGVRYMF